MPFELFAQSLVVPDGCDLLARERVDSLTSTEERIRRGGAVTRRGNTIAGRRQSEPSATVFAVHRRQRLGPSVINPTEFIDFYSAMATSQRGQLNRYFEIERMNDARGPRAEGGCQGSLSSRSRTTCTVLCEGGLRHE